MNSAKQLHYSDETNAWFFQRYTFQWFDKFVWKGYKRPLEMQDVYRMPPHQSAENVDKYFGAIWKEEVTNGKKSLLRALHRAFASVIYTSWILILIQLICETASPMLVKQIISYTMDAAMPTHLGYIYAFSLWAVQLTSMMCFQYFFHRVMVHGVRIRTALRTAIYEKTLKLSYEARKNMNTGDMINLVSIDANKVCDVVGFAHYIWSAPLQVIACLVLLFMMLKWATLFGLAVLILMLPLNAGVARVAAKIRRKTMELTGERIKLINEVLQGIRIIKFYAWEKSFLQKVIDYRWKELQNIRKSQFVQLIVSSATSIGPFMVSIGSFTIYSLLGNTLDAAVIFPALSYFGVLRMPLMTMPTTVAMLSETKVSLERIEKFLLLPEASTVPTCDDSSIPVAINDAVFSWEATEKPTDAHDKSNHVKLDDKDMEDVHIDDDTTAPKKKEVSSLRDITLQIPKGKLTCVVGLVGAGKSSILQAIIGEMPKVSGEITVCGSIAFCSQQAWIQNATVRENILFGEQYDEIKYKRVIQACELEHDFTILPNGDETEIGEKGINLSGGQKQRISLARSVYADRDIYLLDDVLSAVDAHVGKHIFDKCINGALKEKTRILAINQWHFLNQADYIVVLTEGKIAEQGTYDALMQQKGVLADFITKFTTAEANTPDDSSAAEEVTAVKPVLEEKKAEKKADAKLIKDEERATGTVKPQIYIGYMKHAGGILVLFILLFIFIATQGVDIAASYWLAYWTNNSTKYSHWFFNGIYLALGVGGVVGFFLRDISSVFAALKASVSLHQQAFARIVRAPTTTFFDVTPVGRIINRFSKDVEKVDGSVMPMLKSVVQMLFQLFSYLLVICIVTPWFTVALVPILIIYFIIARFYLPTSRELKRLDSVYRSPLFAHFSETLTGLPTIKAYNSDERFAAGFKDKLDLNNATEYCGLVSSRWLGVRIEILGRTIVFFSALFAVISKGGSISSGLTGLSLTYALQVTGVLTYAVRLSTEVETGMNAVERLLFYCNDVEQEAADIIPEHRPPVEWPQRGQVTFTDVKLRYRKDLDLVLKGISANIATLEKVGIVGRTGSGKSTLMQALFRMVELEAGSIEIDGIDISTIGLEDLRSRLVIIPQDPVLFSGTIRFNLDPFNQYQDNEIWKALERSHLKRKIETLPNGLDSLVTEYGGNLSLGERQLLCVCRAILRPSKILLMDEATASVDMETDALIQRTIRTEFKDRTTITIAHRLNTIVDSDKIMVLDHGKLGEYDSPKQLVQQSNSEFLSLIKETGPANEKYLVKVAMGEINLLSELEHATNKQNV